MKQTMTTTDIASALHSDEYGGWSYAGAYALAELLEEMEEATGEEMEFCKVAIRCDFSEYDSLQDWAQNRFADSKQAASALGLELDMDGETFLDDYCDIDDAIREHILDHGQLIEFDGGIIVSSF